MVALMKRSHFAEQFYVLEAWLRLDTKIIRSRFGKMLYFGLQSDSFTASYQMIGWLNKSDSEAVK